MYNATNDVTNFVKDNGPPIAVYVFSIAGFLLHIGVLIRRKWADALYSWNTVLLNTLSFVNIGLCISYCVNTTFINRLLQSTQIQFAKGYASLIVLYHAFLVNCITCDNFLKIRFAFRYDEEIVGKRWLGAVICLGLLSTLVVVVHINVTNTSFNLPSCLFFILNCALLVNLVTTYIYIMYRMVKTRLVQPQVAGYFLNADGTEPKRRIKTRLRRSRRYQLPPSFKKVIYSLPMRVLLVHTIFMVLPNISISCVMMRGLYPSQLHKNLKMISGSFAICTDAVIYLFGNDKVFRHIFSSTRIAPTSTTGPSPSQLANPSHNWPIPLTTGPSPSQMEANNFNLAIVSRDFSRKMMHFNACTALASNSHMKKYIVEPVDNQCPKGKDQIHFPDSRYFSRL